MHTLKGVGRSYAMICPYDVDGVRITFPSLGDETTTLLPLLNLQN